MRTLATLHLPTDYKLYTLLNLSKKKKASLRVPFSVLYYYFFSLIWNWSVPPAII